MSQSSKLRQSFGSLSINNLILQKGHVTQTGAITSGVTLTSQAGTITTVTANNATGASTSFIVTDLSVNSNTLILADIMNYVGGNGFPSIYVDDVTTGSFKIIIHNHSVTDPLNGALKISYLKL
jgi:hypothetical protein